jgi:hypothetical protein
MDSRRGIEVLVYETETVTDFYINNSAGSAHARRGPSPGPGVQDFHDRFTTDELWIAVVRSYD